MIRTAILLGGLSLGLLIHRAEAQRGRASSDTARPTVVSAVSPVPILDVTAMQSTHLTVQPRTMALGARTVHAGMQRLDSLPGSDSLLTGAVVYVPRRALGTRRVPLVVILHGSGGSGLDMLTNFRRFADSTGFILLGPTAHAADNGWDDLSDTLPRAQDVRKIDAAVRQVLKHYAIDPTKLALLGFSAGSGMALGLGHVNGDVFSRVLMFSGFTPFSGIHQFDGLAPHGAPAIYIGLGTEEANNLRMESFASWLRQHGSAVTYAEDTGQHQLTLKRVTDGFVWLVNSWR